MTVRIMLAVCLTVVTLPACGPNPLRQIGEGPSDWIGEPTVSTMPDISVEGPSLNPVRSVSWFNDNLSQVPGTTPAEIIAGVFARSSPSDRFAQATPQEIAAALPGISFPNQLPPDVEYITSQLVYDRSTGQLSSEQVAAFGLWIVEPYTRSRSVGQQGIINVTADALGADLIDSGTADLSCDRFSSFPGECEATEVGDSSAWYLVDHTGSTLVWYEGDFVYKFFLRIGVDPGLLLQVAATTGPLASIVG